MSRRANTRPTSAWPPAPGLPVSSRGRSRLGLPSPMGVTGVNSPVSTSVHRAVMRHSLSEVTQALSRGGPVHALDDGGRTPLFYAAKDGDSSIVDELMRRGANPNAQDNNSETPLHFAAREYR